MDIKAKIKETWENNKGFTVFVVCFLIFRSLVVDQYIVPSGSMLPNLQIGDRILVTKSSFILRVPFTSIVLAKTGIPERGDIVVFNNVKQDIIMVKRLVGLPGDKLEIHDGFLSVNGKRFKTTRISPENISSTVYLKENNTIGEYIIQRMPSYIRPDSRVIEVPEGHYFVMGDNRDNSADSRSWGFVPHDEMLGRAFSVFYSLDGLVPRVERTFKSLRLQKEP